MDRIFLIAQNIRVDPRVRFYMNIAECDIMYFSPNIPHGIFMMLYDLHGKYRDIRVSVL